MTRLQPEPTTSTPPQRRLGPCPSCGLTVLADEWTCEDDVWQPQGPLWSPALGHEHDCGLALIQYAAHWQYAVNLGSTFVPWRSHV